MRNIKYLAIEMLALAGLIKGAIIKGNLSHATIEHDIGRMKELIKDLEMELSMERLDRRVRSVNDQTQI